MNQVCITDKDDAALESDEYLPLGKIQITISPSEAAAVRALLNYAWRRGATLAKVRALEFREEIASQRKVCNQTSQREISSTFGVYTTTSSIDVCTSEGTSTTYRDVRSYSVDLWGRLDEAPPNAKPHWERLAKNRQLLPLLYANDIDGVKHLLEGGADLNVPATAAGDSAVNHTVGALSLDSIRALSRMGAKFNSLAVPNAARQCLAETPQEPDRCFLMYENLLALVENATKEDLRSLSMIIEASEVCSMGDYLATHGVPILTCSTFTRNKSSVARWGQLLSLFSLERYPPRRQGALERVADRFMELYARDLGGISDHPYAFPLQALIGSAYAELLARTGEPVYHGGRASRAIAARADESDRFLVFAAAFFERHGFEPTLQAQYYSEPPDLPTNSFETAVAHGFERTARVIAALRRDESPQQIAKVRSSDFEWAVRALGSLREREKSERWINTLLANGYAFTNEDVCGFLLSCTLIPSLPLFMKNGFSGSSECVDRTSLSRLMVASTRCADMAFSAARLLLKDGADPGLKALPRNPSYPSETTCGSTFDFLRPVGSTKSGTKLAPATVDREAWLRLLAHPR